MNVLRATIKERARRKTVAKKGGAWQRMSVSQGAMVNALDRKREGKRPYQGTGKPLADDDRMEFRVSIADRLPKPKMVVEELNVAAVVEELLKKMGGMLFPDKVAWQSEVDPHLFIGEDGMTMVELTDEELKVVQPVVKRWKGGDRKYLGQRQLFKLAGC